MIAFFGIDELLQELCEEFIDPKVKTTYGHKALIKAHMHGDATTEDLANALIDQINDLLLTVGGPIWIEPIKVGEDVYLPVCFRGRKVVTEIIWQS